jgi:hypothetical protein
MSVESEYKLEDVAAIPVNPAKIDVTFRSSTIGECGFFFLYVYVSELPGICDIQLLIQRDTLLSSSGYVKPHFPRDEACSNVLY